MIVHDTVIWANVCVPAKECVSGSKCVSAFNKIMKLESVCALLCEFW